MSSAPESVPEVRAEWKQAAWEAYRKSYGSGFYEQIDAALAAVVPLIEADVAAAIEAHAENEAERTKWDGSSGLLGNWINGIREGARFLRGELPTELDAAIRERVARAVATGDEGGM